MRTLGSRADYSNRRVSCDAAPVWRLTESSLTLARCVSIVATPDTRATAREIRNAVARCKG
jgi:hypothetical protein